MLIGGMVLLVALFKPHETSLKELASHVVPWRSLIQGNSRRATGFHINYKGKTFIITNRHVCDANNSMYKVNSIQQAGNLFYCIEESITKSAQYILPMLGENFMYYSFNTDLYNVYLSDCYTQLFLVYKFSPDAEYLDLEARLLKHPKFVKMLDPTPELVVTQFDIPEKYWQDVTLIMDGKYSKIDNYTKTVIYSFHGLNSTSVLYSVLFNVELYRKEMESRLDCTIPPNIDLMSKPNLKQELWTYQSILKKDGIVV